jgi:iron-sulfur cluster assembly accessory protein
MPTKSAILDALGAVIPPESRQDIVARGSVTGLDIRDGQVAVELELPDPAPATRQWIKRQAARHIRRVAGVTGVHIALVQPRPSAAESLAARLGLPTAPVKRRKSGPPAVTITPKALDALRQLQLPAGGVLRIGVVAGGCSGHTYSATVDAATAPDDLLLHQDGPLRVVTDPASARYLAGLNIDYSDDLIRSGFRFSNPNAGGSCGCGASFKAAP